MTETLDPLVVDPEESELRSGPSTRPSPWSPRRIGPCGGQADSDLTAPGVGLIACV